MNLSLFKKLVFLLHAAAVLSMLSCASYGLSEGKELKKISSPVPESEQDIAVFLIGDTQNFSTKQGQHTYWLLKKKLDSAAPNSLLLFLGNSAASGKKDSLRAQLENSLALTKNFKGKTLFIPGNHDLRSGITSLKNQEKEVKEFLKNKEAYLPEGGCAIDKIKINEQLVIITVNSEWMLADWDRLPGINKKCEIQTREDFYTELRSLLTKYQNQTVILAMHHPVINTGTHGGFTSARMQLYPEVSRIPLPGLGSMFNILRSTSGFSSQDISNERYAGFAKRMKNILQGMDNVIVVAAHDHNLQYHVMGNIRQIISGSSNTNAPATINEKSDFSYGKPGFAVLHIREKENMDVEFFSTAEENSKRISHIEIRPKNKESAHYYPKFFPETKSASVYPEKQTEKSSLYRLLWGDHYRKYYGTQVTVPVADLSVLEGGFVPLRKGGGNQSNTLRLRAASGQEFVMRAVRKDAVRFLNKVAFKTESFGDELTGTFPDKFISDFYTTVHPYTPFIVNRLMGNIGILHSNPKLYYIPKQNTLGKYNSEYGDELYMIEERFSDDTETLKQLENANEILSTDELIQKLHKSTDNHVEMPEYVRARLFDMLVGDWDRHDDQWKWAGYKTDGKTLYRPIPRDRDQAFSKFDGWLIRLIMSIPDLRHMKSFGSKIRSVKWMNREPYPIDLIFAGNSTENDWMEQAEFIQKNLTEADIKAAFAHLPKEIQDETVTQIIRNLCQRKNDLKTYAAAYYRVLQKKVPLAGTDKKDHFRVTQSPNASLVEIFSKNDHQPWFSKTYRKNLTKEIWLFGLNDDDTFEVKGKGNSGIRLVLAGGYNHDNYKVENGKKVKIYDFRSQNNTYHTARGTRKIITDHYDNNMYNFRKPMYSFGAVYPDLGYNPDDGAALGLLYSYTKNSYIRNPFTERHNFSVRFFTATGGFNVNYSGLLKEAVLDWDLGIDAKYTTPFFTQNFFGLSNESLYLRHQFEESYNRARIREFTFSPSLSKTGWKNVTHRFQMDVESFKVEKTEGRFVSISPDVSPEVFQSKEFGGASYTFAYHNKDNASFPQLGMDLKLQAGWKTALQHETRNFITLNGQLNMDHRIDKKGRFVLANALSAYWISNRNFEFYQAASIGGDNGLRAYRTQRFSGKSFLLDSSEIRWNFGRVQNGFLPASFGVALGYDIGRVWNPEEDSDKWHQSVGGSIWMNVLDKLSLRLNGFTGEDGLRISFGLGMGF